MMNCLKYHHIGIACYDISATKNKYENFGYTASEIIFDPIQNVNICFLTHDSTPMIELLAPVDETSPIIGYLSKNSVGPYHICYAVENIDETIRQLKKERFIIAKKPEHACALNNNKVCFLFNKDMGLIELVEAPKS